VNVWILNHYAATRAKQATHDYDLAHGGGTIPGCGKYRGCAPVA